MRLKAPDRVGIIFIVLTIALSSFIFIMSSQDATESADTSSGVCEAILSFFDSEYDDATEEQKLQKVEALQFWVRKGAHFSVYCVLAIFAFLAMRSVFTALPFVFSLMYCLLFSISDEIHQSFVPGRSCELRDVCIDFSGAILGTILIILFLRIILKKKT